MPKCHGQLKNCREFGRIYGSAQRNINPIQNGQWEEERMLDRPLNEWGNIIKHNIMQVPTKFQKWKSPENDRVPNVWLYHLITPSNTTKTL